jgi:hypothetical protein
MTRDFDSEHWTRRILQNISNTENPNGIGASTAVQLQQGCTSLSSHTERSVCV